MFSPGAFSGLGFVSGAPSAPSAPSVSAGYDGFDAAQISQNIAMAQALQQEAGALSQAEGFDYARGGEAGALSQAEGFDYARDAQAQAQEFDAMRDAEGGRLHADSLTGVPFAGGVTVMRNAAGRPMGQQTLAANLPFGAGTLAQQIMTRNTLVEPDDGFGFNGALSTGSLDSQPSFGNPDMDMVSGPSQNEFVAAQQPPTPGVAGAPQAFGSPGPYDEYRARIGPGSIGVDPVEAHNYQLMRAALGAR